MCLGTGGTGGCKVGSGSGGEGAGSGGRWGMRLSGAGIGPEEVRGFGGDVDLEEMDWKEGGALRGNIDLRFQGSTREVEL